MRPAHLIALICLCAACSVPQLNTPGTAELRRTEYPQLRPLAQVLAAGDAQAAQITPGVTDDLAARAANLRARAATLRQDAVTPADREHLRAALLRLRQAQRDA